MGILKRLLNLNQMKKYNSVHDDELSKVIGKNIRKIRKEITNIIAVALTEEEQEIWLNTKEQLGKLKDKDAIFELFFYLT